MDEMVRTKIKKTAPLVHSQTLVKCLGKRNARRSFYRKFRAVILATSETKGKREYVFALQKHCSLALRYLFSVIHCDS